MGTRLSTSRGRCLSLYPQKQRTLLDQRLYGRIIGWVARVLTFIVAYIYCIATYGFLLGFGLGWLPSAILGVVIGILTVFLWLPAALVACIIVLFILLSFNRWAPNHYFWSSASSVTRTPLYLNHQILTNVLLPE
jgi:hypothetical protein